MNAGKVPYVPVLPISISASKFFFPRDKTLVQHVKTPKSASSNKSIFNVRVMATDPLTAPVPSPTTGSRRLRTFLLLRERYPDNLVKEKWEDLFTRTHDMERLEGVPRVAFVLGKEVAKEGLGDTKAALRNRFRRRAKVAFRIALERIRSEESGVLWLTRGNCRCAFRRGYFDCFDERYDFGAV
jgi:hypothetical protein